ncbi:hypothetical protein EW145_g5757 [Phellinidium pouzarii]|uniref:Ricin B lectin domain-containing protein n=1 Tax=Phellinidium pouzarii TaxID=167371 RepID=A0A4S4L3P2_9AGAM|nr:hypothetical protein EW145_g5757 [Phellinidium pouzarii]
MVALAPIALSANAVTTPVSGNTYIVENIGFAHWLDNANAVIDDGNPILSWVQNSPETTNQEWTYLTYPTTSGATVFTLQSVSTIQSEPSFDDRGGYIRVDSTTNKLVQGGQPMAWTLIEAAPGIFKMSPFDDLYSDNGRLVATDINSTITTSANNQAELQIDETLLQQLWTFNNP